MIPPARPTLATILAALLAASAAPSGAQPYDPPEDRPAYWTVPGFKQHPLAGPERAKGILFWSHGVKRKEVQWDRPPAPFVRRFARAGWDVVKVNRNNLHECRWTCSGVKHVRDLAARARKARADGYRRVVLAGQSYGGAISLEVAAEEGLADAVVAAAPNHGSDSCGGGSGMHRIADTLTSDLVETIRAARVPRIVLTMADGDDCMGFNKPSGAIRAALMKIPARFLFLDDTMPVRGHGAAGTVQFDRWFGDCVLKYVDAAAPPDAKESGCAAPSPLPRYAFKAGFSPPAPPAGKRAGFVGMWEGEYAIGYRRLRNVCVVVSDESPDALKGLVAFGAGSQATMSMRMMNNLTFAAVGEGAYEFSKGRYSLRLARGGGPDEIEMTIDTGQGRSFEATLKRGCKLRQ